jgi:hypothetical protein
VIWYATSNRPMTSLNSPAIERSAPDTRPVKVVQIRCRAATRTSLTPLRQLT